MELQELISRARLLFRGSPKRSLVFSLVNGKRSAKEISIKTRRPFPATLQDLQMMKDYEIIRPCSTDFGILKKNGSMVYEKSPLIKHIPGSLLKDHTKTAKIVNDSRSKKTERVDIAIRIPTEQEILDICRHGEDQPYEFKRAGVDTRVLSKEICAFANTRLGGLILYGVEDDGSIGDSDKKRAELDQSLMNSLRNTVSPYPAIKIVEKTVLGNTILLILVSPWNKKDVYHYEGRVCIRKGTNVFYVSPGESKKLHSGSYVI